MIQDQPSASVSASVAAILMTRAGLDVYRVQNHGKNPRLDRELNDLAELAALWTARSSANGTPERPESGAPERMKRRTVTSSGAADLLGITARGVTKACRDGRIVGQQVGRTWFIPIDSIEEFKLRRGDA